jgi:hypothetical protein
MMGEMLMYNPEEIEVEENQDMKSIKAELQKAFKWLKEDEDVEVSIKVYDAFESEQQTYDVEINYAIGDDVYTDGFINQTFYGRFEGDELAQKQAVKRAKAVLKTVKGWFANNNQIKVVDGVEVYHA